MRIKDRTRDNWSLVDRVSARKVVITSKRVKNSPIWQIDGSEIFVTCKSCDAINNINPHRQDIHTDGNVHPCFVCINCAAHYFVRLDGWKEQMTIRCSACGRRSKGAFNKGELRKLRQSGWRIDPKDHAEAKCRWCAERKV